MADREQIMVCKLGMSSYGPTWELQKLLQKRLITAKRAEPRQHIQHVILLVEHPHVYTLGKSGDRANLLASEEDLDKLGASFVHIDRGGDITYHGPGQLVMYPILDMDYFYHDVHRFLRDLEDVVIRTCSDYGVAGTRIEGRTGVWILPDHRQVVLSDTADNRQVKPTPARKICALGIRFSRWVSMHGIGFNISTDLDRYSQIIPCGITDGDVTSLERESESEVLMDEVAERILSHFGDIFNADLSVINGIEADTFLKTYLAPDVPPAL